MRESFTEEPRKLLSWLSNHIPSLRRAQKTHHSLPRRKEGASQAKQTPNDESSSVSPSWPAFSLFVPSIKPSPSFPNFASLPSELRIQIWEFALFSTPRVVQFKEIINITPWPPDPWQNLRSHHLFISTPIPPSLQICCETRELALKRYIFSDGSIKLYLDPEIDTLYFGRLCDYTTLQVFASCAEIEDLWKLKRLAIGEIFLNVLGRHVWNGSSPTSYKGPAFGILSGLQELILIVRPENGKSRGLSTLGPLFYERYCPTCREMDWWVGMDGWIFPTYQQFVKAERNGVKNVVSEKAYREVLEMLPRTRSVWLWEFVNRRMQNVCKVDFNSREGKFRACSVAGLYRLIDLLNEL